jgi:hypothetical protein
MKPNVVENVSLVNDQNDIHRQTTTHFEYGREIFYLKLCNLAIYAARTEFACRNTLHNSIAIRNIVYMNNRWQNASYFIFNRKKIPVHSTYFVTLR